jgi:class 3 adenylate cyclase/tetratricopeptide (TPR) repeat protein
VAQSANPSRILTPYVPRLVPEWLTDTAEDRWHELEGSVVFVDISGFTQMSEKLAKKGKVGAEEVTNVISSVFARLLSVAYGNGGSLLKFGGDALLLLFTGDGHEVRAARASVGMRTSLREIGRIQTSGGGVTLRMSVGVHSGRFLLFLVGDSHRELLVTGPAVSRTVEMEGIAEAGEIVISAETAAALPRSVLGLRRAEGFLLRRVPPGLELGLPLEAHPDRTDLLGCIPLALREHLLAGVDEPEHRPVTVAFVHFDGVDELVERDGPGELAQALELLVVAVQRAADSHGVTFLGTDIDHDGGKIILTAGAPQVWGDDEQRMLLALRAIVDGHPAIPVRIGVNRGHVFAGEVGPPYRRTYTVMGDAVNLAARVMAKAQPGEVLATRPVLDASAVAFDSAALEPFSVKGKKDPVEAFAVGSVLGLKEAGAETPLVGRERELEAFRASLDAAAKGDGRLVEIVGPPGIGKTRLLAELRRLAGDLATLAAACELYSASTPYHPFRTLLRRAVGIDADADAATAGEALRALVRAVAPELRPWEPLLAVPLDVDLPETREVAELGAEFRKQKLEEVTAQLLGRVLTEPTVLLIEDVHWIDEASSDLLARLATEAEGRPWLICVTRRDEETGYVAIEGDQVVPLRPAPLSASEAEALVVAATEQQPLRPHELAALTTRSGGNPLFLQELVRAARGGVPVGELPGSIESMVMAEIDRLPPADRLVLRRASVLGVSFAEELVSELFDEEEPIGESVWSRLGEYIEREAPGRRRFRHALVRDAAYEGLPFSRRRDLHARVAETTERLAGDAVEEHAEVLSLHFLEAGRHDAAWRYSLTAGERARMKYANAEAADFFRRALEASRQAEDLSADEIAGAWEALGDVTEKIGALTEAAGALREARRRLRGNALAEARLLRREAEIAERSGRYVDGLRLLGRGLKGIDPLEGPAAARERAQLSVWYASGRFRQGRHRDAVRWCEKAIEQAEAAGDREALAWAYMVLDMVHIELGTRTADAYGQLALSIYEQLGNLPRQASLTLNLGGRAYYESRWSDAIALYEQARDLYARTGDTFACADATFNIGEIRSQQWRLPEAEALLQDARRMWRASGDRVGVAYATSELGRVAYRSGRTDEAFELLDEAAEAFAESGADAEALETEARRAECLLYAGEAEGARELIDTVRTRAQASGEVASLRTPRLLRLQGWALAQLGDLEGARALLEESIALGHAGTPDLEVALALEQLAALRQLEGEPEVTALTAESAAILELLGVERLPAVSASER